jgi:membrane protein implicated in regulation of membrane protease activity
MSSTAAMTVAFFAAFASVAWSATFAWARWLARPNREPTLEEQNRQFQVEQRLAGIEQAVQAIAGQVEGLVESQRFANRLPAELSSDVAAPRRVPGEYRKVDTPH